MEFEMFSKEAVEGAFGFIRPDEFAECKSGVLAAGQLYEKLWSFVDKYEAPRPEVSEEHCYGMDSIARFWNEFSEAEQAKLFELDKLNHEDDNKMMIRYYQDKRQEVPSHYLEPYPYV